MFCSYRNKIQFCFFFFSLKMPGQLWVATWNVRKAWGRGLWHIERQEEEENTAASCLGSLRSALSINWLHIYWFLCSHTVTNSYSPRISIAWNLKEQEPQAELRNTQIPNLQRGWESCPPPWSLQSWYLELRAFSLSYSESQESFLFSASCSSSILWFLLSWPS